jgi:hypothetical protein
LIVGGQEIFAVGQEGQGRHSAPMGGGERGRFGWVGAYIPQCQQPSRLPHDKAVAIRGESKTCNIRRVIQWGSYNWHRKGGWRPYSHW